MPSGGFRPGSGRPKGAKSQKVATDPNNPKPIKGARTSAFKKRVDIARKALDEGITPLEVMLKAMREALANNDLVSANGFAKDAAPYVHPRLAAVAHSGTVNIRPSEVDDAKLLDIAFGSGARIAPPESDTKVTH